MANAEDNEPLDLDAMQVISQAVAATEKEIFGEMFGGTGEPEDETGDRSLEEMEASPSGEEDEAETVDADGAKEHAEIEAGKTGEQPRAEDGTFKAAGEKEAATAAQVKELTVAEQIAAAVAAERETANKAFAERFAALEAKIAPAAKVEQSAPAPQPVAQAPDMFLDPVGHQNWLKADADAREGRVRAEFSLRFAEVKHGETFTKAYAEFGKLNPTDPQQQQIGRSIAQARDPGEALVAWYRQNETLKRVGADPEAYEARVREEARTALAKDPEFRKQVLADLQKEAATGDTGKPRTIIKLPPSLSAASGSNSSRIDDPELLNGSERSIFAHAFRSQSA